MDILVLSLITNITLNKHIYIYYTFPLICPFASAKKRVSEYEIVRFASIYSSTVQLSV